MVLRQPVAQSCRTLGTSVRLVASSLPMLLSKTASAFHPHVVPHKGGVLVVPTCLLAWLRAREGPKSTYCPGTIRVGMCSVCLVFLCSLEVITGPY